METKTRAGGVLDFQGLARLRAGAAKETPEAKREAAQQFEALLLQTMLKSMRQTGGNEGLMEGPQSELYRDLHDQQLALHLARNGSIGFADVILRELGNKQSQPLDPEAQKADPVRLMESGNQGPADNTGAFPFARALWSSTDLKVQTPQKGTDGNNRGPVADTWVGIGTGPKDFVKSLWPAAVDAAHQLGTKPEAILAISALETGWGRHVARHSDGQSSHNLFGIKASRGWQSRALAASTQEFEDGRVVRRSELFRSYESPGESIKDFVSLMKNSPRYAKALSKARGPAAFLRGLQQAGYATDPNYSRKLESIMNSRLMRVAAAEADRSGSPTPEAPRQFADAGPSMPVEPPGVRRAAQGPNGFVKALWPDAVKAARELGTAPEAALAVAALHAGWDRPEAAVKVVRDLVASVKQDPGLASARHAVRDPIAFVNELQKAGYAEDPHYAKKLKSLINGRTLRAAIERLKKSEQMPIA
ncbi:MAG: flagellar assembly peptidoglycan hydrolase FlgJ [Gammaproteobacteria bacterium]